MIEQGVLCVVDIFEVFGDEVFVYLLCEGLPLVEGDNVDRVYNGHCVF